MSESSETWLPVVGYEGLYEVSDLGRVRSLPPTDKVSRRHGKVLKPKLLPSGYYYIRLYLGGARTSKNVYIHQVVAAAFIGPCPPGEEVRHGPCGKGDNRLANLGYGCHIENCEDRARDGSGDAKLTRTKAAEIRVRVASGEPRKSVAADFGVSECLVRNIVNGTRWSPNRWRNTPAA